MTKLDKLKLAHELISAVESALRRGVKHVDDDGRELRTTREVIEALQRGPITLVPPDAGGPL
jgi:hypothetical protein